MDKNLEKTIKHYDMTKLTFEEMTAAMVIAQLTRNNSNKTLVDVNEFLEADINMENVCRWLEENKIANVAYDKHGLGCTINCGAQLLFEANAMFCKKY